MTNDNERLQEFLSTEIQLIRSCRDQLTHLPDNGIRFSPQIGGRDLSLDIPAFARPPCERFGETGLDPIIVLSGPVCKCKPVPVVRVLRVPMTQQIEIPGGRV